MKQVEKSRFAFPCVSKEQIPAFDINRPETWTASPLVNAVLDAIEVVRPARSANIAHYLGIDSKEMGAALHLMTGMGFLELMEFWRKARFAKLLEENPGIAPKEMVNLMAFSSQGALWTFLTRNKMIEPMDWHWDYGKHLQMREKIAEEFGYSTWKEDYKTELNRRKWEELTKHSK